MARLQKNCPIHLNKCFKSTNKCFKASRCGVEASKQPRKIKCSMGKIRQKQESGDKLRNCNIHLRVHSTLFEYCIYIFVANMEVLCDVLVLLLTGSAWANSVDDKQNLLQKLFGDVMPNNFNLNDIYFTLRPDGAPNKSTLYRFNLTYGKIVNIGDLLMPKSNTCRLDHMESKVSGACHFNIKDAQVKYFGQMSYGKDVVQTFDLYALITEFPFGDHINPASLTMIVLVGPDKSPDIRQCLITEFMLSTVTFPPFWSFNYTPFKKNETLAVAVWDEFQVKMYTHVRLTVKNAIKDTCIKELHKKSIPRLLP